MCDVTIDGRRARLRPGGPTDTIADLARALGAIPGAMRIDGAVEAGSCRLADSALRVGSAIATDPAPEQAATVNGARTCSRTVGRTRSAGATAVVELAVVAGPSCTVWRPLPPGRHAVGRAASADIRLDDDSVELHHGVLDVDDIGSMVFIQLTGRVPVRIGGQPCDRTQRVVPGDSLLIGASRIDVRAVGDQADQAGRTSPVGGSAGASSLRIATRGDGSSDADRSPRPR